MFLGQFVTDLGNRVKDFDVTQTANKDIAKRYINRAYKWIYRSHRWEFRRTTGQVVIIPNVTGSCSFTKFTGTNEDSARTVTISGASDSYKGRYFQIDGSSDWHKILYVDVAANKLYLETPILDSSGTTYQIWKRFYYLPGDVGYITDFGRWDQAYGRLDFKDFTALADQVPNVSDTGFPDNFVPFGDDKYETSYKTGTIQGNQDENIITGVGTTWLGNVLPGDLLLASTFALTVKRVETNTRIILQNYIPSSGDTAAIPTGSTYEIKRNVSLGFAFYPSRNNYLTLPFVYMDRAFDMVHETKDRPNLPDDLFDDVILTRAEYNLRRDKGDSTWVSVAQLYEALLSAAKEKVKVVEQRSASFSPNTLGYPGR